jgi:hypothetical protein
MAKTLLQKLSEAKGNPAKPEKTKTKTTKKAKNDANCKIKE